MTHRHLKTIVLAMAGLAVAGFGTGCQTAGVAQPEAKAQAPAPAAEQAQGAPVDPLVAKSRDAVKSLGGALKGRLEEAMQQGGPVNALGVCNIEASGIADKVSKEKGVKVSRVSEKNRNPNNAADGWKKAVLENFAARYDKGEALDKMEFSETVTVNGKKEFRYMKPIGVQSACLDCHGKEIKPDVQAKLKTLYPNDKATGYKTGDLRGAFVVVIPQ